MSSVGQEEIGYEDQRNRGGQHRRHVGQSLGRSKAMPSSSACAMPTRRRCSGCWTASAEMPQPQAVESALAYGDVIQIAIPGPAVAEFARTAGAAGRQDRHRRQQPHGTGGNEQHRHSACERAPMRVSSGLSITWAGRTLRSRRLGQSGLIFSIAVMRAMRSGHGLHGLINDVGLNPVYVGGLDRKAAPHRHADLALGFVGARSGLWRRRISLKLLAP